MPEMVTFENLDYSRKVVRGKDWRWGTQDCDDSGTPLKGQMVKELIDNKGKANHWVAVIWGENSFAFSYRTGPKSFDLYYADERPNLDSLIDGLEEKIQKMEERIKS